MSVLQHRKFEVVKPFKYNGKELERGDEWVPGEGRWDDQLVAAGKYVRPVPPETFSEVSAAFGDRTGQVLSAAGYTTIESLKKAKDEDLLKIKGVGKATLEEIREGLK